MKRADYISWDEYFMGIAMLAARRSTVERTGRSSEIRGTVMTVPYRGCPVRQKMLRSWLSQYILYLYTFGRAKL